MIWLLLMLKYFHSRSGLSGMCVCVCATSSFVGGDDESSLKPYSLGTLVLSVYMEFSWSPNKKGAEKESTCLDTWGEKLCVICSKILLIS